MIKQKIWGTEEIFRKRNACNNLYAEFLQSVIYDPTHRIFKYEKRLVHQLSDALKALKSLCALRIKNVEGEVKSKFLLFEKVSYVKEENNSLVKFMSLQTGQELENNKDFVISYFKDLAIKMWYCKRGDLRFKIYEQLLKFTESIYDERNKNLIQSMSCYPFETDSDAEKYHKQSIDKAYEEAIRLLKLNIEANYNKPFLVEEYSERGRIYYLKRDFEQARSDYFKALQVATKPDWLTLHRLSILESDREFYSKSIEYDLLALQSHPFFAPGYNNIGVNEFFLGDYKVASEYFQIALNLDNLNPDYLSNMGFLSFCMEDYDNAIKWLEDAKNLSESNPPIGNSEFGNFNLGLAYFRKAEKIGKKELFERAEEFFHRAFGLHLMRPMNLGLATSSWFMLQRISEMKGKKTQKLLSQKNVDKSKIAGYIRESPMRCGQFYY